MVGSIVVAVGLAETALVLADARPTAALHLSDRRVTVGLDCYPSNPRGYFEIDLRDPATRERFRSRHVRRVAEDTGSAPFAVELRYNRRQFRDREFGRRVAGRRRVLVLGDSFTEGQGVKEPDVLPRVLERLLAAEVPGGWEVLNGGRRGTDFPVLRENFEALLDLDPDVAVYAMMLNDPETTDAFRARHASLYRRLGQGWQPPTNVDAFFRVAEFVKARVDALRVDRETTRWYHELYGAANQEGWRRTQADIVEMDRRMRARGGRLLVVTWPVLAGLDGAYPFAEVHARIAAFCRRAGIAHHDLLPALSGQPEERLWVHPVDRHPNEAAHRRAAASLAPVVRRMARTAGTAGG